MLNLENAVEKSLRWLKAGSRWTIGALVPLINFFLRFSSKPRRQRDFQQLFGCKMERQSLCFWGDPEHSPVISNYPCPFCKFLIFLAKFSAYSGPRIVTVNLFAIKFNYVASFSILSMTYVVALKREEKVLLHYNALLFLRKTLKPLKKKKLLIRFFS